MSRRKRSGDLTSVVCTRFADVDKEWLEQAADSLEITTSDIVRAAVKYYRQRDSSPLPAVLEGRDR